MAGLIALTAREKGIAAKKEGRSAMDNPYVRSTPDWWNWYEGWKEGTDDHQDSN